MKTPQLNDLRQRAAGASTVKQLDGLLREVRSSRDQGSLNFEEELQVLLEIYTEARRLIEDQPEEARSLLFDGLLPLCVDAREVNEDDFQTRIAFQQCRELAGGWLNDERGEGADSLIERALGERHRVPTCLLDHRRHRLSAARAGGQAGSSTP